MEWKHGNMEEVGMYRLPGGAKGSFTRQHQQHQQQQLMDITSWNTGLGEALKQGVQPLSRYRCVKLSCCSALFPSDGG